MPLVALAGCSPKGTNSPTSNSDSSSKSVPKFADLNRPFNAAAYGQAGDKEPLTFAKYIARSAGGVWIAFAPKPLDEVKSSVASPRYGFGAGSTAPGTKVIDFLNDAKKAGTPICWESRPDYNIIYFGPQEEFNKIKILPPAETVGLLLAGESVGGLVKGVAGFWRLKIEADPELLKLRERLLAARKEPEDDEGDQSDAAMARLMSGLPPQAETTMVEFKVAEHMDQKMFMQRLAGFLGGVAEEKSGGAWKFAQLTGQKPIADEIKRLRKLIEDKAANAPSAFTSYSQRTGGGGDSGEEEMQETQLPPPDDETRESLDRLVMLGLPAVETLSDFLNVEKPSLASAALTVLGTMKLKEANIAIATFARDLRIRAKDKALSSRRSLESALVKLYIRNPSPELKTVLEEMTRDVTTVSDTRLKARLALAAGGAASGEPATDITDPSVAEKVFQLQYPPDPLAPVKPTAPPAANFIKPLSTFSVPAGDTWAVFASPRYGSDDDLWLARGSAGVWKEFLFTGRKFERDQNSGYRYRGGGGNGGPKGGGCVLKVEGDKIMIEPPDAKLAAEVEKMGKAMRDPKLPQADRNTMSQKYYTLASKLANNLKVPITLSLESMRKDTDGDGLTDLIEARLMLDPAKRDTNASGQADGKNHNPRVRQLKTASDRVQLLNTVFRTLYGGDPSPDPIVVVLEKNLWQEFKGTSSRVLCVSPEEYNERYKDLSALRTLQFGGPRDSEATILIKEGPCLFNDNRTKAEVHFWQTGMKTAMSRYQESMGRGGGTDYMARFERKGEWKLVSVKQWKVETSSTAAARIQARAMMNGGMEY